MPPEGTEHHTQEACGLHIDPAAWQGFPFCCESEGREGLHRACWNLVRERELLHPDNNASTITGCLGKPWQEGQALECQQLCEQMTPFIGELQERGGQVADREAGQDEASRLRVPAQVQRPDEVSW